MMQGKPHRHAFLLVLAALVGAGCLPADGEAEKARRVLELKAQGIIDEADGRVMLGLARDRGEALRQLAAMKESTAAATATPSAATSSGPLGAAAPKPARAAAAPTTPKKVARKAREGERCAKDSDCGPGLACFEDGYDAATGTSYLICVDEYAHSGRPLIVDGEARVADGGGADLGADAVLAAAFDEHASIAAFARTLCSLMALGAPLWLLQQTQAALADEIAHAADTVAHARTLGAPAVGFGQLPAAVADFGDVDTTARRLLEDVILGGCIGETLAVDRALRQSADPQTPPALVPLLGRIADDEARHAALAFKTVGWLIEQFPDLGPVADDTMAAWIARAPVASVAQVLPSWRVLRRSAPPATTTTTPAVSASAAQSQRAEALTGPGPACSSTLSPAAENACLGGLRS